ncbi:hypothetical protein D9615_000853 [Tricholomella constricta]|uniref:Uncharacterized protein n=1 Tax=Tricholomella constricta TaxID=117010 RepID=A0A8H5HR85_9AGAR|nr:hypothetical protein D9615_000853 [Tricholomella constricta]
MSAAETKFNYVLGALTLIGILYSARILLHKHLPRTRMELFDSLLVDTRSIYDRACAENLLPPDMTRNAKVQLQKFEIQGDDLRVIKYHSLTLRDILNLLSGGRWSKIAHLSKDLMDLRSNLVKTSQEEWARRNGEEGNESETERMLHSEADSCDDHLDETNHLSGNFTASSETAADVSSITIRSSFLCSLLQWLSTRCTRSGASSPSDNPTQGERRQATLSDPDSLSRSSTLVDEPLPKAPCWRQVILGKWGHDTNGPVLEDLEAGGGPRTPLFFETRGACGEPTEMDITSVRV